MRYHGDLGIETKSLISPKRYRSRMSDLTPIDNSRVAVTKVFFSSGISLGIRYMGMYSVFFFFP